MSSQESPKPITVQARKLHIDLPSTMEARFCNAFRIDREIFPGHHLLTFAAVIENRVAGQISFTVENGRLLGLKPTMLQYLNGLRAARGRPEFVQPETQLPIDREAPRPVDEIVLTQNAHTAEFAFYSWAWVKTYGAIFVPPHEVAESTIQAFLYPLIRCTASLQIAWIEEIYGDDARNQAAPAVTFDATPKQLR